MQNFKMRWQEITLLNEYTSTPLKDLKAVVDALIEKYGEDVEISHNPGYDGDCNFSIEVKVPAKCVCAGHLHSGKRDCKFMNCLCWTPPVLPKLSKKEFDSLLENAMTQIDDPVVFHNVILHALRFKNGEAKLTGWLEVSKATIKRYADGKNAPHPTLRWAMYKVLRQHIDELE